MVLLLGGRYRQEDRGAQDVQVALQQPLDLRHQLAEGRVRERAACVVLWCVYVLMYRP